MSSSLFSFLRFTPSGIYSVCKWDSHSIVDIVYVWVVKTTMYISVSTLFTHNFRLLWHFLPVFTLNVPKNLLLITVLRILILNRNSFWNNMVKDYFFDENQCQITLISRCKILPSLCWHLLLWEENPVHQCHWHRFGSLSDRNLYDPSVQKNENDVEIQFHNCTFGMMHGHCYRRYHRQS